MPYCVIETGSKQYRVKAGDTLEIERLAIEAGQPVTFDRVLLVNNDGQLSVGSPTVAEAAVVADVVEHIRGCHVFPDSVAIGQGENPQWLYTVCFDGPELWGEDSDPNLKVSIEAFEPYLEPV